MCANVRERGSGVGVGVLGAGWWDGPWMCVYIYGRFSKNGEILVHKL